MYTKLKTLHGSFVTDPERWLGHSTYFAALFSGKWADKQEDGSYFIETDGVVFEHILQYLRTGVLPVFYDFAKGHDFALYHSLLSEAKYFGVDRLCRWLCEKKYLEAVKIRYLATETTDRSYGNNTTMSDPDGRTFLSAGHNFVEMRTGGHMEVTIRPITQQRAVFYCPDGRHEQTNQQDCRNCAVQAADDNLEGLGGWRNEDSLKWCIVRKEVIFDYDLCIDAFPDETPVS